VAKTIKVTLKGDWKGTSITLRSMKPILLSNMNKAVKESAKMLRQGLRDKIERGDPLWPRLSEVTSTRKGHGKPLYEYGDLRKVFVATEDRPGRWVIGVVEGKKNRLGRNLTQVAFVQEYGELIVPKNAGSLIIPLTWEAEIAASNVSSVREIPGLFKPKGKKVLAIKVGKTIKYMFALVDHIKIPPRPFMEPTFRKYRRRIEKLLEKAAAMAVMGKRYSG
jgi:hypothetical protein